jgi:nitroimidazol reductase NimA-like FMN-containing flavoprotein (pyridoxamine 5'-phosphate oxidase superfamily)
VAVTHVDGLVVARSGFHSSANYRSVVVHGVGRILEGEDHAGALDKIIESVIPGRLADLRPSTRSEIDQTSVIELSLDEVSAKVRTGGPKDDPEDLDSEVWAGILPLHVVAGQPIASDDLTPNIAPPDYLVDYRR